jgi:hypothetical protein
MSEMVERVAQALCECDAGVWDTANRANCDGYRELAKAAIKAMKEPTEEMIEVGRSRQDYEGRGYVPYIWRAMIAASL